MKNYHTILNKFILFTGVFILASCSNLEELNKNPNGISTSEANVNLLMPSILRGYALANLNLGYQELAGTVQHTQKDGWWTGHNQYDWGLQDWNGYYTLLRSNRYLGELADKSGSKFHMGVHLAMRGLLFGTVTDLWGDAPYTDALKGDQEGSRFEYPAYDSQEAIYKGVIQDLENASKIFEAGNFVGVLPAYDLYFAGNATKWHQFTNSLLLRYAMRISSKLPDLAKKTIESVYKSGVYFKSASDDLALDYIGASQSDSWPSAADFDQGSNFRRIKPASTLLNKLIKDKDPRLEIWFRPVHCKWVEDNTLTVAVDPFIRKNGVLQTGTRSFSDVRYLTEIGSGAKFTRHYNPKILGRTLDTSRFVGVPTALMEPSEYNLNPTPGQQLENQHVSQLADVYRGKSGGLLKARIISASEVQFILAEAALNGWAAGQAKSNYEQAIKLSLDTWGVGSRYSSFISNTDVAYAGTLKQIIEQKWISSWTNAGEAWFDYRRTGFPQLKTGPASPEPVVAVRFTYGNNEINFNAAEVNKAVDKLQVTFGGSRGKNNQWAKPWLLQGTGKPW